MGYREKVPDTFGKVSGGLYFGCRGCTRGQMFERAELLRRWGSEGRVSDLATRLVCSNCKAKRKRPPPIYVEVVKVYRSKQQQARATMEPVDALVFDIGQFAPLKKID